MKICQNWNQGILDNPGFTKEYRGKSEAYKICSKGEKKKENEEKSEENMTNYHEEIQELSYTYTKPLKEI